MKKNLIILFMTVTEMMRLSLMFKMSESATICLFILLIVNMLASFDY
jgi:hypothetical protein